MKLRLLLGALILTSATSALAGSNYSNLFVDGVAIGPLVSFLEKEVVVLDAPMTIYNWSPNGKIYDNGAKNMAETAAKTFWRAYGSYSGAMYGLGLYGAADPVSTFYFGGGMTSPWLLMELSLPVGFRMIDVYSVSRYSNQTLPDDVKAIVDHFKCRTTGVSADGFFTGGGGGVSPECQAIVRTIYKDILRIDGFAYSYGRTYFKDCMKSDLFVSQGQRAFVITDHKWMTPTSVKYYTANSTDSTADRTRIQTLFLKGAYQVVSAGGLQSIDQNQVRTIIESYLDTHEDSNLKDTFKQCDDATCTITARFCDSTNRCENIELPKVRRPTANLITEEAASGTEPRKLLWPDLKDKAQTPKIVDWMKQNLYTCGETLPFKQK
jgi:hypothetical protein